MTIFTTIYTDGYNWIIPSNTRHLPAFSRKQHPVDNWYWFYLVPQQVNCISTCNPHAQKEERQIVLLRHIPICYQLRRPSSQQPRLPLFSASSHFTPSAHICSDPQPHPHPRGWKRIAASITENIHMLFCRHAPYLDYFLFHFVMIKGEMGKMEVKGQICNTFMNTERKMERVLWLFKAHKLMSVQILQ